jgi:hypothetical protein
VVNRQAGEHARNLEAAIRKRVLGHLSVDQLRLMLDVARAKQQGSFLIWKQQPGLRRETGAPWSRLCYRIIGH